MINLPFCRRRLFFDKIACALFSALLCAASASAEVLVSEGCDMASDYAGAAAISANGTIHVLGIGEALKVFIR